MTLSVVPASKAASAMVRAAHVHEHCDGCGKPRVHVDIADADPNLVQPHTSPTEWRSMLGYAMRIEYRRPRERRKRFVKGVLHALRVGRNGKVDWLQVRTTKEAHGYIRQYTLRLHRRWVRAIRSAHDQLEELLRAYVGDPPPASSQFLIVPK